MGPREIKNMAEPVRAYGVLLDGAEAAPRPAEATSAPGTAPLPAAKPKDTAARLQPWRRLLWRFGVILVFLGIINLATSTSLIWFSCPSLDLGLVLPLHYPTQPFPAALPASRRHNARL